MNLTDLAQAAMQGDDERAERLVAELDHRAAPDLQAMLTDVNPDVRWWAVRALAAVDANSPAIVAMLNDEDSHVRACAALALAGAAYPSTSETETAVHALADRLADPDSYVGSLCALALAHMGAAASPALVRALEEHRQNAAARIHAARALSSAATPEAIPALIHALEDDSVAVQYYAEEALMRLGVGMVLLKP